MKAEIFYASGQEDVEQSIRRQLSSRISPQIEVEGHPISGSYADFDTVRKMYQQASRYVRLLQGSIPPSTRLQIGLTGESAYGFYTYSVYADRTFFFQEGFGNLLPALAIRDRMMLVPFGLSKRLTGAEELLSIFRPLEMGGVVEVDFNNYGDLDAALSKAGEKLRAEVIQEFRAFASYRGREEIDFGKLAQELGVDWRFIKDSLQARAREMTFYNQLSCRLDVNSLPVERWTQLQLTVVNDSDVGLSGLAIDVAGPVQILPRRLEVDVGPHSSADLKVSIKAGEVGEFPLEFAFLLPGDQIFRDWMPVHHVWLEVHGTPEPQTPASTTSAS
jgi:hypothetical protein